MPGKCARDAREMCKGCRGNVLTCENKVNFFSVQLEVEQGLLVREEFDKKIKMGNKKDVSIERPCIDHEFDIIQVFKKSQNGLS